ncbi:class I SAM-dependent methyltransferase [archaeon]|nr:class I SAM-dependent methyltransferase [archaeon]
MFDVWLKSKITDKILLPIKKEIIKQIPKNSKVIEIGSGTGSLLFLLSKKIKKGVGIDINSSMVNFSNNKAKKLKIKNLKFKLLDAKKLNSSKKEYNVAISMLTIHTIDKKSRTNLLRKMSIMADKIIIVDYKKSKLLINLEEMLTKHHRHFIEYIKNGGITKIINESNLIIEKHIKTKNDAIDIWICKKK